MRDVEFSTAKNETEKKEVLGFGAVFWDWNVKGRWVMDTKVELGGGAVGGGGDGVKEMKGSNRED